MTAAHRLHHHLRGAGLLATLATLAVAVPALAQSFPDTPLQVSASRPSANIMFILDDSGSMGFDYIPDTLSSDDFYRKNAWLNPLAYDPRRTYRPWKDADASLLTGGTGFSSAYSDDSRLTSARDLRASSYVFYYPKAPSTLAKGNTNKANYYEYTFSTSSSKGVYGATTLTRCDYKNNSNWDKNCSSASSSLPSDRTLAQELANYATWYSYHRTRMKTAKNAVFEAFSQMPSTLRVGYDSIWNRSPLDIPVGTDNGQFRDGNKEAWFTRVRNADASGGTPLHGAMIRAGRYFSSKAATGPWGPESGANQFSCRQNFAILTTDGYWNDDDDYGSSSQVGNADGEPGQAISSPSGETYTYTPRRPFRDDYDDTLADVAMYFWKTDLRPDLDNNVPSSAQNPAFWQHMSTFGISMGLEGTLDPTADLLSLSNGSKAWPDPWRTTSKGSRSWGAEGPRRIDDLWHATVNGRGQFSVVSDPESFVDGMRSTLASIQKVLSSGSNVSTSSTSLQTDTRVFHATYFSGLWTGELSAFDLSSQGISQDPAWLGSGGIIASGRKVFTASSATAGTPFPTAAQSTNLASGLAAIGGSGSGADIADYLKGNTSKEISRGGTFRNRESLLGDIVNSSPAYATDSDTLFVGANDGMLHAFNATTGAEVYAYVPRGLDFQALGTLASPDYEHKFFVDGQVAISSKAQTPGKNYLVAAPGRGAKGVFALDVTNPQSLGASNLKWDYTASVDADMGYVLGDILIAKANTGDWLAFVPNGIDSANGHSVLFAYRLSDGTLVAKLDTGVGGGNGLSAPRGWDEDNDGDVDEIYAGDLKGNLWKFDVSATAASSWALAFSGQPLFKAVGPDGTAQPITSGVALAREAFGDRRWVLFGTGRYISQSDITNTAVQSVYGIIDATTRITARTSLQQRSMPLAGTDARGNALRSFETHGPLDSSTRGWFIDLTDPYDGERVIERGFVSGRVFTFPSVAPTPGNACEASGKGFINAIDAFTGTSVASEGINHPYFDVGQDEDPDNDWLEGDGQRLPVGSLETSVGMVTRPVLVGDRLVYGGSTGGKESQRVKLPPPAPKRLYWRELLQD